MLAAFAGRGFGAATLNRLPPVTRMPLARPILAGLRRRSLSSAILRPTAPPIEVNEIENSARYPAGRGDTSIARLGGL